MPPVKFTKEHAAKLPDPTAEAVRRVADTQIRELQTTVQTMSTIGRLLRAPRRLTGNGTMSLAPGTRVVLVEGIGQGGGGGGAQGGVATAAAGGGGSSGAYALIPVGDMAGPELSSAVKWSAGTSGGGGGAAAGGNGSVGADTTLTVGGKDYTWKGGGGGLGCAAGVADAIVNGGAPASGSSAADAAGARGERGMRLTGTWLGGAGGAGPWGIGGSPGFDGVGGAGIGYGAGGGGAGATTTDRAGGAGAVGSLRIWEFG